MLPSAPCRARLLPASTGLLLWCSLLLAGGCSGGTPASCPSEYPTSCPAAPPAFDADVAPLIQAHCAVCHGPGQQIPRLDTYEAISLPLTRQKVFFQIQHCSMPPAPRPPLSAAERDTILTWLVCSAAHD